MEHYTVFSVIHHHCIFFKGKLVHTLFGKKKSDLIDPMLMMKLRVEVGSPLIINVLSDLLSNTAYTHQLPEIAQLVQGIPPTKLPIMSVNFVSFGLASQALAVKLYRSCLRANPRVQLPLNTHENFLKVSQSRAKSLLSHFPMVSS